MRRNKRNTKSNFYSPKINTATALPFRFLVTEIIGSSLC